MRGNSHYEIMAVDPAQEVQVAIREEHSPVAVDRLIETMKSPRLHGSALRLAGRLWNCGADDMAVPGMCEIVPNLIFVILLMYMLSKHEFGEQLLFENYAIWSLAIHATLVLWNGATILQACRTQLFEKSVIIEALIYGRFVMFLAQLVLALYGTIKVYNSTSLNDLAENFFHVLVVFNWIEVAAAMFTPICVFSVFGHERFDEDGKYCIRDV